MFELRARAQGSGFQKRLGVLAKRQFASATGPQRTKHVTTIETIDYVRSGRRAQRTLIVGASFNESCAADAARGRVVRV